MMWYAMRHEKADITEHDNIHDHEADEEKWKHKWLERMERRELVSLTSIKMTILIEFFAES